MLTLPSEGEEYLGIFLHFMRGENDDILAWPWQGRLTITLVSQRQGEDRCGVRRPAGGNSN